MTSEQPASRADNYETLTDDQVARWAKFGRWEDPLFPQVVGLQLEEVRRDYARMRLP
jgi:hypothetical protein